MDGISAVVFQIINVGSVRGVGSAVPVTFSTLLGQTCYLREYSGMAVVLDLLLPGLPNNVRC